MNKKIYLPENVYEWKGILGGYLYHNPSSLSTINVNEDGKLVIDALFEQPNVEMALNKIANLLGVDRNEIGQSIEKFCNFLIDTRFGSYEPSEQTIHNRYFEAFNNNMDLTTIYIHLTYNCNLTCFYCYNSDVRHSSSSKREMNLDEWESAIRSFSKAGVKNIVVTGGEPLLEIEKLLFIAKKCNEFKIPISLLTNGILITEESAKEISSLFSYIQISLDSTNETIMDLHRGKGSFIKAIDAIRQLKNNNADVHVNSVITKYNVSGIPELVKWCYEELGVNSIQVSYMLPMWQNEALDEYVADINLFLQKRHEAFINVPLIKREEFNEKIKVSPRYHCGAAIGEVSISPDGFVYPCQNLMDEYFVAGNILESDILDIYKNSPIMEKVRYATVDKIEGCNECNLRYICGGGCRANAAKMKKPLDLTRFPGELCAIYRSSAEDLLETICLLGNQLWDINSNEDEKEYISLRPLI